MRSEVVGRLTRTSDGSRWDETAFHPEREREGRQFGNGREGVTAWERDCGRWERRGARREVG